ncbi:hypothetical protein PC129_g19716 [Phytophthora cactorum]|uniref:Uncharacterized protein n=1 Tax=Phytophthora cactorum TaxID=29920 RepID=A0A8T1HAK8_9STRA|nr:hypothetical protein Pcac1_g18503 [Phytophthora cactorum]KAG2832322.1 hypothetical protein PC112_g6946 [Phytophthora cactorum]KAG2861826.1 hypothetical protein PC113_g6837 [Phytophthora cactorum]KAG2878914.1 hypothetical protein PC114_g22850 [Phytophthora cactorum]KAG2942234.1 hypothetical protein PC117_g9893 [Phytophthora cactorum]
MTRWNTETRTAFMRTLESREATHERMSLSALAAKICALSCDADRQCCFVHHLEGCESSRGCGVPRPSASGWRRPTSETSLSDSERREIARYQHAFRYYMRTQGVRRGLEPRPVEDLPPLRGLPRTPPRSPERRPAGLRKAPSYRRSDPASAQDIRWGVARLSSWRRIASTFWRTLAARSTRGAGPSRWNRPPGGLCERAASGSSCSAFGATGARECEAASPGVSTSGFGLRAVAVGSLGMVAGE